MYVDKDSNDRYAIMDLSKEQLETIHRALSSYQWGLCMDSNNNKGCSRIPKNSETQYARAGAIVRQVEKAL